MHITVTNETINGHNLHMEGEVEVVHSRSNNSGMIHETLTTSIIARGYDNDDNNKHDSIFVIHQVCNWTLNDAESEKIWLEQIPMQTLEKFAEWHNKNFPSLSNKDCKHFDIMSFKKAIVKNFQNNLRMNEDRRVWHNFIDKDGTIYFPNNQHIKIIDI